LFVQIPCSGFVVYLSVLLFCSGGGLWWPAFATEISFMICLLNSFCLMLLVLPVAVLSIVDTALLFNVLLVYKFT